MQPLVPPVPMRFTRFAQSRRRLLRHSGTLAGMAALVGLPMSVQAIMAGLAPDSPDARIDPNTADSPWSGVVAVLVRGGVYSGVLIHRRLVLTAGHVAGGAPAHDIRVQFNLGPEPLQTGVESVYTPPGWRGFSQAELQHDLAVLVLDASAPPEAQAYPVYTGPLLRGTVITLVGYGASGHGDTGPQIGGQAHQKRVGRNRADRMQIDEASGRASVFYYDFDGPDPSTNLMGGPTLGNAVETAVAGGDSGGPVFIERGEYRAVVGISTFAAANGPQARKSVFGAGGGGVMLAMHEAWLTEQLRRAGP